MIGPLEETRTIRTRETDNYTFAWRKLPGDMLNAVANTHFIDMILRNCQRGHDRNGTGRDDSAHPGERTCSYYTIGPNLQ